MVRGVVLALCASGCTLVVGTGDRTVAAEEDASVDVEAEAEADAPTCDAKACAAQKMLCTMQCQQAAMTCMMQCSGPNGDKPCQNQCTQAQQTCVNACASLCASPC
jgi:hypothetical protein